MEKYITGKRFNTNNTVSSSEIGFLMVETLDTKQASFQVNFVYACDIGFLGYTKNAMNFQMAWISIVDCKVGIDFQMRTSDTSTSVKRF